MYNSYKSYDNDTFYESLKVYKDKEKIKLDKWLKYIKSFKSGKQGYVALMKTFDNENEFVIKISQGINFLINHEYTIMKGLSVLNDFCPYFCKVYGKVEFDIPVSSRKHIPEIFDNKDSKKFIKDDILVLENVKNASKFCKYIYNIKVPESVLYSTIKQVLLAISIAQKYAKFTHYDLHSDNVLMTECDEDLVILYIIDKDNQFLVPTNGFMPKIIDFGFSYIKSMDGGYLWPSMGHTCVGFLSDRFDPIADPKLFLVTTSYEIKNERNTKNSNKLRRIVKNIYDCLSIEMDCGWDNKTKLSVSDHLADMFKDSIYCTDFFRENMFYCIDIIQTLIILPIEFHEYDNIHDSFKIFVKEFKKLEDKISNHFYLLYILKSIAIFAREEHSKYISKKGKEEAVYNFRRKLIEIIDSVAKFISLKDINFEKLLCSIILLARNIEGFYYVLMKKTIINKNKEYSKLELTTPEQIYGCIEVNIPDKYEYSENTKICILDCVNKETRYMKINKETAKDLNNVHSISRGAFLYQNNLI
jgi:hypothetical protein